MSNKRELRTFEATAELGDDKRAASGRHVSGLGIVYDKEEMIFPGLMEQIKSGAVQYAPVVRSYFNHDPNMVLSSTESTPPLELTESRDGLRYRSPIPPTGYGEDLTANLGRRNVTGSSFAFEVVKDRIMEDSDGILHREISELVLHEIGPVTSPAYVSTTAHHSARDLVQAWRELHKPEPAKPAKHNGASRPTLRLNGRPARPSSAELWKRLDRVEAEAYGFLVPMDERTRQKMNLKPGRRRTEAALLVRHGRLKTELDL